MATAADIVRDALKLLGILAAGESLKSEDQADGIRALNLMLGTWANERLLVHGTRRATYTLTPSLSPHTIGATGTFATTRPLQIDRAAVIPAGTSTELPLEKLTDAQYQDIPDKAFASTIPTQFWVEQTHPNAKLWLWPVPTTAATLVLYTWSRITEFAAGDTVTLPDGYEDALIHALALRIAPAYGAEPGGRLMQNASDALAGIQRTNSPDVVAEVDPALLGGRAFDIYSGDA
jgi:hypothetical protein